MWQRIGKKIELALLDAVLNLAAGAIALFVEIFGFAFAARERGDDEARISFVPGELRLGGDGARGSSCGAFANGIP